MSRVRPGVNVNVDIALDGTLEDLPPTTTSTVFIDSVDGTRDTTSEIVMGPDWGPGPKQHEPENKDISKKKKLKRKNIFEKN